MFEEMQEYVADRGELLRGQVRRLRKNSAESVQKAVSGSADKLKGLKSPVRAIARSGVKLSTVSQETIQNLIELQSDAVTATLSEVALRLERAAKAPNLVKLVREQIELAPATRDRIVGDAGRAVAILRTARRDLQTVAKSAYAGIVEKEKAAAPAARRKTAKRGPAKKVKTGKRGPRKTVASATPAEA
jgi:hypothetical protein